METLSISESNPPEGRAEAPTVQTASSCNEPVFDAGLYGPCVGGSLYFPNVTGWNYRVSKCYQVGPSLELKRGDLNDNALSSPNHRK